jgi:uncharacterized protein YjbI with pentapeptide repeats
MNQNQLDLILKLHLKWLNNEKDGKRANLTEANLSRANLTRANLTWANLTRANLSRANLTRADLTWANLTRANLSRANLTWANLTRANLTEANLSRANLTRADLDFSSLPLWCGSFNMIVDDNILEQILTHVKMLNISKCSKANQKLVNSIPERVKDKLKKRYNLDI